MWNYVLEESGDLLDQPLEKASTQVVPAEGDQESDQIVNEVPSQATSQLIVKPKYRSYALCSILKNLFRINCI